MNINKPLRLYIKSIHNEMRRDIFMQKKYLNNFNSKLLIPRIEKIIRFAKETPTLVFMFFSILQRTWFFFPYWALIFYLLIKFTVLSLKSRKAEISGAVALISRGFNHSLLEKSEFCGTKVNVSMSVMNDKTNFNILSYIKVSDVWQALKICISLYLYIIRYKRSEYKLQTYTSFTFFLLYFGLSRLLSKSDISELWIYNDSDRWALLFDYLGKEKKVILLQHGLLKDFSDIKTFDRPSTPLPYRLQNINRVFIFDFYQIEHYKAIVLGKPDKVSFQKYITKIHLVDWPEGKLNFLRVLIIGQPQSAKEEVIIAKRALLSQDNLLILIRPHPFYTSRVYNSIKDDRFFINSNRYLYPKADLVLFFSDSTLAYEYLSHKVKVLRLNQSSPEDENIKTILKEIRSIA